MNLPVFSSFTMWNLSLSVVTFPVVLLLRRVMCSAFSLFNVGGSEIRSVERSSSFLIWRVGREAVSRPRRTGWSWGVVLEGGERRRRVRQRRAWGKVRGAERRVWKEGMERGRGGGKGEVLVEGKLEEGKLEEKAEAAEMIRDARRAPGFDKEALAEAVCASSEPSHPNGSSKSPPVPPSYAPTLMHNPPHPSSTVSLTDLGR